MNNDTNIKSMPDINTSMSFDVDSQALISAISSAISNGFENLNSLQVDAVAQIEENKENIATNTQSITTINNSIGDFITPVHNPSTGDLNNYTKTGIYTGDFSGFTNYPATNPYAMIEVISSGSFVRQTITVLAEQVTTMYVRMYGFGAWRSWRSYTP